MVTVGAGKGEGFARNEKFGRVQDTPTDYVVHVAFTVYRVSGTNTDLEGHVLLCFDLMSHPDSREAAMAEFMLYAVSLT